jgi:hypothetical protein
VLRHYLKDVEVNYQILIALHPLPILRLEIINIPTNYELRQDLQSWTSLVERRLKDQG